MERGECCGRGESWGKWCVGEVGVLKYIQVSGGIGGVYELEGGCGWGQNDYN